MPKISTVDAAEARSRLRGRAIGQPRHAAFRAAIANLADNRMLEVDPDEGETLRGLKLNVTRAAKEINRQVGYGVSSEGTLLVWLERPKLRRRPRRRQAVTAG